MIAIGVTLSFPSKIDPIIITLEKKLDTMFFMHKNKIT